MQNKHDELLQLLTEVLTSFQADFGDGLSEFELISKLIAKPFLLFDKEALSEPLILFQTHFILFHALYDLRNKWRQQNVGELDIHALQIKLNAFVEHESGLVGADPLADYYLDWQNLAKTDEEGVEDLLNLFWQKMAGAKSIQSTSPEEIKVALGHMNLETIDGLQLQDLKRQYRKLQHECHPDKGGTAEQAQVILAAYTTLYSAISNVAN